MDKDTYLAHYGILRRSGRYPWGSGSTENVRNREFLAYFDKIKADGNMSITEACKMVGISTTEYRAARTIAKAQQKQQQIHMAQKLRDKGWSHTAISEKMFGTKTKESTVRSLLADDARAKIDALHNVSKMLEDGVAAKKYIDIGTGVEQHLGIAESRLKAAVAVLKEKGYQVIKVQIDQLGTAPGNKTTIRVLAPPGTTYKELNANKSQIQQLDSLGKFSKDNGRTILGIKPPLSISSRRVGIIYADQGGSDADGVIYVRPGVKDISLGSSHYAQVRIMVDGTHYLKGMAVYKPDMPKGVDLQFNTNKNPGGSKLDAMKELKTKDDGTIDLDNPFGAQIKPNGQVLDPKTGKVTSVMNKINEEGDWDPWSKTLSSQFLSKQSPTLAKRQLQATYDAEREKLDEIMSLTNPAVRAKLLESFADGADSSAVHLKAAALPGQASRVILPIPSMKETEVYAPTYRNGDRVVLIRYPHGGTFEIPELTVNNNHRPARAAFGDHPPDAIGINPKVAAKLSGADFDGDSVIVIPQRPGTTIKNTPSLKELKDFNPQREFPPYDGMKTIDGGHWDAAAGKVDYGTKPDGTPRKPSPSGKQQHMGKVSNLITDMTIRGASMDKVARAVRHSMVVIDAEKHHLDYKQSEIDNGIKALQQEFQARTTGPAGGASTLISRAGSVDRGARAMKQRGIDPITGKKILVPKGEEWVDKRGKTRFPTAPRKKLEIADDAFTLTSGGSKEKPGTTIEAAYAEHSNRMKALANMARKELANTKLDKAVPSATRAFATEVNSLNAKLNLAIRNRPLERQAQIYANTTLAQKRVDLPDMDASQIKRVKFQALQQARSRVGAGKDQIQITPQEWQAIQARAISPSKLKAILDNADLETVKKLATPRQTTLMSGSNFTRAQSMLAAGHTQAEVAQALGVSLTTLKNSLRGEG